MALTVEDGTGLTNADAYVATATVDTYNTNHEAKTSWSGATTANKEKWIRLATQYLDLTYGGRWRGSRYTEDQALDWPRTSFRDQDDYSVDSGVDETLPTVLEDACSELAIALSGGDTFHASYSPQIESHSYSNEAKSETLSYEGARAALSTKAYPRVDLILRQVLHHGVTLEGG